jgi:hypothetical protein
MLWLQNPQWGRWSIAVVLTVLAIWAEFGPDPSVQHPFATQEIAAGDEIGPHNTENRPIPRGLLNPIPATGFATRVFLAEEPITVGGIAEMPLGAPQGWWSIEVDLPTGVVKGDEVELILLDTGATVAGRVTSAPSDDPLADGRGSVAIPPEMAVAVASAVVNGRVAVLVRNS